MKPPESVTGMIAALADAPAPVAIGDSARLRDLVSEALDLRNDVIPGIEQTLKSANARYDELRKVLIPEAMQHLGLVDATGHGSFTHSSGARVHLQPDLYVNVRKDDKPALFDWLRHHGHGDLIREDVHNQTLRAFVKELREDGHALPPGVHVDEHTKAVLTTPKKKGDSSE